MAVKSNLSKAMLEKALGYLRKDPMANFPKLLKWAGKIPMEPGTRNQYELIKDAWENGGNWRELIEKILTEVDPHVRNTLIYNIGIHAGIEGAKELNIARKKYDRNIPWAILMDPTSACNLKCIGCWAAEYKKTDSMSYELLDDIIKQGKELGIRTYIYSGGEPTIRKADLIGLARKHKDCVFLAFTNGTLFDEAFAKEIQEVGNITFAISVEGFKKENDMRRGEGTFDKIMAGMDILKAHGIPFGFSTCYHSGNVDVVGSEEYIDLMIEKGCYFGWYFTYIPLGKDAVPELLANAEQREFMYHQLRKFRKEKPLFTMDFWNDGEHVDGCIAGGRRYLHINAAGDVEPCAFIHYSSANIHDVSLLEALGQPLFKAYREGQPFNQNMLRPCPLLDNPECLRKMVLESDVHSTQPLDKEDVRDLTDKTKKVAEEWSVVADRLWQNN
ncbi:radical SAM protein [Clostridia bacterium]|nr:radical SAM protein [Clostridia bacterium]